LHCAEQRHTEHRERDQCAGRVSRESEDVGVLASTDREGLARFDGDFPEVEGDPRPLERGTHHVVIPHADPADGEKDIGSVERLFDRSSRGVRLRRG